jgi:hypothetical protein
LATLMRSRLAVKRKLRARHASSIPPMIGQCAARYLFDMGHRVVMNVMCLRRYTMELRLGGQRPAL